MIYLTDINGNTSPDYFTVVNLSHSNNIQTQTLNGVVYNFSIPTQGNELILTTTTKNFDFLNKLHTKLKQITLVRNGYFCSVFGCYLKTYEISDNIINATFDFDFYNIDIDEYRAIRLTRKMKLEKIEKSYNDDIEILDM